MTMLLYRRVTEKSQKSLIYSFPPINTQFCSHRTTSISSFLNRTVSFSQLNTDKEEEERDTSRSPAALDMSKDQAANLSTSSTTLSKSLSSISGLGSAPHSKLLEDDGHLSASIGHLNQTADSALSPERRHGNRAVDSEDEGAEMETAKGGYLGRFTTERRGELETGLKCTYMYISINKV